MRSKGDYRRELHSRAYAQAIGGKDLVRELKGVGRGVGVRVVSEKQTRLDFELFST